MPDYHIVLLQPPGYIHALAFQEVGALLLHSFRSLGLSCQLEANVFEPKATNIVLGYHLLSDPSVFDKCRCIPYQLEQLSEQDGWITPQQPVLLQKASEIWDFSPQNLEFLAARGFTKTRLLPLGFHEQCRTIVPTKPDIDVLFYGSLSPRRRAVIETLAKQCTVKALFGIYGAERDAYIARSRIILNMHQFAAQLLEEVRIAYLLNNHCFVVSEETAANPFEGAIVTAPYEQLVDTCLRYLCDPKERQRIADAGFAQFQRRPMTENLRKVLDRKEDGVWRIEDRKSPVPSSILHPPSSTTSTTSPLTTHHSPLTSPRISLCMIVKNEENNLPTCLNSVADLVDEIVIADTGSTDRTKEVAARFSARVSDFRWVDNFAAARNASIEPARGQWIFWLDADDYLDAANRRKLQALFAGLPDENVAYSMRYLSLTTPTGGNVQVAERLHLFRNRPDIRWINRVHEQIGPAILKSGGVIRPTDIEVRHGGYVDPALRQRKEERNLRLSQMKESEQPNDGCVLFHLGRSYLNMGRSAEALPILERGIACADPSTSMARKIYLQATRALLELGQLDKALTLCRQGEERFPDDAELLYQESYLRIRSGDLSGAEACLLRILQAPPGFFCLVDVDPALIGYRAHFNLAIIYRDQGRLADAERAWRAVIELEPSCTEGWVGLTELLLSRDREQELQGLVQRLRNDPRRGMELAAVEGRIRQAGGRGLR